MIKTDSFKSVSQKFPPERKLSNHFYQVIWTRILVSYYKLYFQQKEGTTIRLKKCNYKQSTQRERIKRNKAVGMSAGNPECLDKSFMKLPRVSLLWALLT